MKLEKYYADVEDNDGNWEWCDVVKWTPELQEAWDNYRKQKECKYCTDGYTTLIDSTKLEDYTIGWDKTMLATELDDVDNSVVFEIRNNSGYIRLGDRGDMKCLDHGDKVNIDCCPFCGRKLGE